MSLEAKTAALALVLAAAALAAAPAHKPPPHHARILTAADMPVPRAGQWEKTSNEDGPLKTSRHCEDGKPVRNLDLGKDCKPSVVTRSADGWVITAHCSHEGSTSVATITARGDFATTFVSDLAVDITRPDGKHDISTMHAVYRYIGACPAGETTP